MAIIIDNTKENIEELENKGYVKSPVSKPYGTNKILRYDRKRGVYWFCSNRCYYPQDTETKKETEIGVVWYM